MAYRSEDLAKPRPLASPRAPKAEAFNPFSPKPGQEEMAKAYWAAHWASNPEGGELYEGEL